MKYVANLFSPIPKAPKSHVLGWSKYWESQLGATILRDLTAVTKNDTIYVDHGVNFSGGLNLFGGVSDELAEVITHLTKVKPKLVSLDVPMPDYGESLLKRVGAKSTSSLFNKKLADDFCKLLSKAESLIYPSVSPTWISVGYSHTFAYAKPGSVIHRTNGLTLHGLLESWDERFPDLYQPRYNNLTGVTIVAGSIDVRHHLFRQPDPKKSMLNLVDRLVDRAKVLNDRGFKVELCVPVPVEYDGRPLPKTGYYKGTPFFGSQSDRSQLTLDMARALKRRWSNVVTPPKPWYNIDPEYYAESVMERGGSVHIAPTHYRSTIEDSWGYL